MTLTRLLLAVAVMCAAGMLPRVDVLAQQAAQPAQPQQPAAPQAPRTPRSIAPIDLTGYWVAMVNEDWRWRMMTPAKGDYASVPLTDQGRKVADAWDYEKDQTPESACKPFGVGNIMRMPGRLHITWQDDRTLKLEFDAGTQTRLLYFDNRPASGEKTWQGHSLASWEVAGLQVEVDRNGVPLPPAAGGRGRGRGAAAPPPVGGSLKVVATSFRAGHLRKNGVPYSENASITEYFDRVSYPSGDVVLLVRTTVEDPVYLNQPFIVGTTFKLEKDGSKWKPTPCAIDPPVVRPSPR